MTMTPRSRINEKRYQSVVSLDAPSRYDHFIKVAADRESVWGLWSKGWLLEATNADNTVVFPVWPEKVYADRYIGDDDGGLEAVEISIYDFLDELIPSLKKDSILLCVFPVKNGGGPVVSFDVIEADLKNEISRY